LVKDYAASLEAREQTSDKRRGLLKLRKRMRSATKGLRIIYI